MREKIQQRLQELKSEYETGQKMLTDLEAKQLNLRETLLRIDGAIQALEEVLQADATLESNNHSQLETSVVAP
jgi:predicted nuclease with TOPRIM domain